MITQSALKELLHYDLDTGFFTWREQRNNWKKVTLLAGYIHGKGYRIIKVNNIKYYAHRLAWLYIYGELPSQDIDHINGNRVDNRIINLRLATRSQNQRNVGIRSTNKLGVKGVKKDGNKYIARIVLDKKLTYLGRFASIEEASLCYNTKAAELHCAFYRDTTTLTTKNEVIA